MRYTIVFWHGYDQDLADRLASFCDQDYSLIPDKRFSYEGSLDEFAEKYGFKFIVDPHNQWIAVSHYPHFGMR